MKESCLCQINIASSLGLQETKRACSGAQRPQEIARKIRAIQAVSIDEASSMKWSFAGIGRQWGSVICMQARLQLSQLISERSHLRLMDLPWPPQINNDQVQTPHLIMCLCNVSNTSLRHGTSRNIHVVKQAKKLFIT